MLATLFTTAVIPDFNAFALLSRASLTHFFAPFDWLAFPVPGFDVLDVFCCGCLPLGWLVAPKFSAGCRLLVAPLP